MIEKKAYVIPEIEIPPTISEEESEKSEEDSAESEEFDNFLDNSIIEEPQQEINESTPESEVSVPVMKKLSSKLVTNKPF